MWFVVSAVTGRLGLASFALIRNKSECCHSEEEEDKMTIKSVPVSYFHVLYILDSDLMV